MVSVAVIALAVSLLAGLGGNAALASAGDATLTLGVKPCDTKDTPACNTAEILVKDSITVSVEMKTFNVSGRQGYDAWEADVCWPHDLLVFESLEFKGGPQGKQVSSGPTAVDADITCSLIGASVGVGEDSSQVQGNLANLNFTCKNPFKDIMVFMRGGNVILGDKDSKVVPQSGPTVDIDCRSGSFSVIVNDADQDDCSEAEEDRINEMSQELAGIDLMDPNVFDFPDAAAANSPYEITIGDVLAYAQNFGRNDPNLGPNATSLGAQSDPPASVHDVSQPNNDQIGTDDILRAALLFGVSCA